MTGFAVLLAHRPANAQATLSDALLSSLCRDLRYRAPDAVASHREGPAGFAAAVLKPGGASAANSSKPTGGHDTSAGLWRHAGCVVVGDIRLDGAGTTVGVRSTVEPSHSLAERYRAGGVAGLRSLHGDFAFALWDQAAGRLLLQRDRFGVKPLYLTRTAQFWIVSNTFPVVRKFGVDRLNTRAIGQFLLHGLNVELDSTGFAEIAMVPPGAVMAIEPGGTPKQVAAQELRVPDIERGLDTADIDAMLRPALRAAVADRIRDAAEVTVALSGGLDSGCVAAAAQAVRDPSRTGLRALAMDDSALVARADEAVAAAESAAHLKIPLDNLATNRWAPIDPRELAAQACPPEPSMSLPGNRHGIAPNRATVGDVLLTGHCGDALWVPNRDYFWRALAAGRWLGVARDWSASVRFAGGLPPVFVRSGLLYRRRAETPLPPPWLRPSFLERIDLRQPARATPSDRNGGRSDALESLRSPVWPRMFEHLDAGIDRGAPVPVLHPWLDHRVVDACLKLPSVPWCLDKLAVRLTLARDLAPAITSRVKTVAPQEVEQNALRTFFTTLGPELIADGHLEPYVDTRRLTRMLSQVERLRPYEYALLARPLYLAYWLRHVAHSAGTQQSGAAGAA